MSFKLINSDLFLLPNNPHMIHLGTISKGLQEYIVMLCIRGPKSGNVYIEETVLNTVDFSKDVFANLKYIQDEALVNDLAAFAREKGLLNIERVMERVLSYPAYQEIKQVMFPLI